MKVLCVGRNYARHARELGQAVPESPIWFWKPDSAIIGEGEPIVLPAGIGDVHHEVELAVRIGRDARRIDGAEALEHVDAFTVANDVTARDLQQQAKAKGEPWARAKGFDTFLPLGAWQPFRVRDGVDLQALDLHLAVDGQVRQAGSTSDMVWSVAALLAKASTWTTMRAGDILLTGTPEGVGPMRPGQKVVCELVGHVRLQNPVVGE
jgi:2-keto-4-pentenoate hydratase/2-oxohepta-3-ene-1,7-dioic acid hydratase in catechol pathway